MLWEANGSRCHCRYVECGGIDDFESAVIEKDTKGNTFCGNVKCGKVVAPMNFMAGSVSYPR